MRDNSIVRISEECMAIDLNIEHLIGYIKKLHTSKGLQSKAEHLGDISTCIKYLMALKKRVGIEMETAHKSSQHTTPDTSKLVWRVFHDLKRTKIQILDRTREANLMIKPFIDLRAKGHHQLVSISLKTFNDKMRGYKLGEQFEAEVDELEPAEFSNIVAGDDDE
ncbi:hypothetical protein C8J56DRAFT_787628 [Mycena floridula]|nr:hypothetical protein C8J56DRAFT_787628 [Mycena floridula]